MMHRSLILDLVVGVVLLLLTISVAGRSAEQHLHPRPFPAPAEGYRELPEYTDPNYHPKYKYGITEDAIDVSDITDPTWPERIDHILARPFMKFFMSTEKYEDWEDDWTDYVRERTVEVLESARRQRAEVLERRTTRRIEKELEAQRQAERRRKRRERKGL